MTIVIIVSHQQHTLQCQTLSLVLIEERMNIGAVVVDIDLTHGHVVGQVLGLVVLDRVVHVYADSCIHVEQIVTCGQTSNCLAELLSCL